MAAGDLTTAIRADVLTQFGRDTTNSTEQGYCLTWLQYAYRKIMLKVGKNLAVKKTTTLSTAASTATLDLPSDFQATIFLRDQTNNANLNYQDPEEFVRDHNEDETAGQATDYTIEYNATTGYFRLRLGPEPDSIDTLGLDYYAWPSDISASLDPLVTAWREALFQGGCYYAARYYEKDNPGLIAEYKQSFGDAIGDVYRLENRREPKRRVIPLILKKSDMEPYVKRELGEV